jgi:hypothetical protein
LIDERTVKPTAPVELLRGGGLCLKLRDGVYQRLRHDLNGLIAVDVLQNSLWRGIINEGAGLIPVETPAGCGRFPVCRRRAGRRCSPWHFRVARFKRLNILWKRFLALAADQSPAQAADDLLVGHLDVEYQVDLHAFSASALSNAAAWARCAENVEQCAPGAVGL